jgi:hypothetical protein
MGHCEVMSDRCKPFTDFTVTDISSSRPCLKESLLNYVLRIRGVSENPNGLLNQSVVMRAIPLTKVNVVVIREPLKIPRRRSVVTSLSHPGPLVHEQWRFLFLFPLRIPSLITVSGSRAQVFEYGENWTSAQPNNLQEMAPHAGPCSDPVVPPWPASAGDPSHLNLRSPSHAIH